MTNCSLSLNARLSGKIGLRLTVKLDSLIIFDSRLTDVPITIQHDFSDRENHVLEITMSEKQPTDTVLDNNGSIIDDRLIHINNIKLDDIDIDSVVRKLSRYTHDFNGSEPIQETDFYGILGCNGTVRFEFSSPVYSWLLENI